MWVYNWAKSFPRGFLLGMTGYQVGWLLGLDSRSDIWYPAGYRIYGQISRMPDNEFDTLVSGPLVTRQKPNIVLDIPPNIRNAGYCILQPCIQSIGNLAKSRTLHWISGWFQDTWRNIRKAGKWIWYPCLQLISNPEHTRNCTLYLTGYRVVEYPVGRILCMLSGGFPNIKRNIRTIPNFCKPAPYVLSLCLSSVLKLHGLQTES